MYTYALIAEDKDLEDSTAQKCHLEACKMLTLNGLVPTPQNYLVAYEVARGDNKILCDTAKSRIDSGVTLDQRTFKTIFERFLTAQSSESSDEMMQEAFRMVAATVSSLENAGSGLEDFSAEVAVQQERLNSDDLQSDFESIVTALQSSTAKAQENSKHVQEDLVHVQQEAQELRQEIERLRIESQTDGLTGLLNRKALETIVKELDKSDNLQGYSVLMLDIDHFKNINDTFGHMLGDLVIKRVAQTIKTSIRGNDMAVRYGGEEYLLILPDTPANGAEVVAESLRAAIEKLRLVEKKSDRKIPPFTVSVGVAWRHGSETSDAVINRADKALYVSKASGRNRCSNETEIEAAANEA